MASHASNSVDRDALRERERQARALLLGEMQEPPANPIFAQPIRVEPGLEDAVSLRIRSTLGEFNQVKPFLIRDAKDLIGVTPTSSIPATPQPQPSNSSQGPSEKHRLAVANAMAILDKKKSHLAATAPILNGQRKPHTQNGHMHRSGEQKIAKSHARRPPSLSSTLSSSTTSSTSSTSTSSLSFKGESKPLLVNGNLPILSSQGGSSKGSLPPTRRPTTPPLPPVRPSSPESVKITLEGDDMEEADTAVESILQEMKLGIPTPLTAIETPRLDETRFHFSPPSKVHRNPQNQCGLGGVSVEEDSKAHHLYSGSSAAALDVGNNKHRTSKPNPYNARKTDTQVSDSEIDFPISAAPNDIGPDHRLQVLSPLNSPCKGAPCDLPDPLLEGVSSHSEVQHSEKQVNESSLESNLPKNAGKEAMATKESSSASSSDYESSSEEGTSSEDEDGKPSIASSPERILQPQSWGLRHFLPPGAGSRSPGLCKMESQQGPDPSPVDVDVNHIVSKYPSELDDYFSPKQDGELTVPTDFDREEDKGQSSISSLNGIPCKDISAPITPASSTNEHLVLSPSSSSNSPLPTSNKVLPKPKSPPREKNSKKKVGRPPVSSSKSSRIPPKESDKSLAGLRNNKIKSREYVKTSSSSSASSDEEVDVGKPPVSSSKSSRNPPKEPDKPSKGHRKNKIKPRERVRVSSSSSDSSDEEVDVVSLTSPVKKIVQSKSKKSKRVEKPKSPATNVKPLSSSSSSLKEDKTDSAKVRSSLSVLSNCADPDVKSNVKVPPLAAVATPDEKECKENVVPQVLVRIQLRYLERVPPYPPQSRALLKPEDSVIRQRTKRPHSPPPESQPPPPSQNHRHRHHNHQHVKKESAGDLTQRLERCPVPKGDANTCDRVESVINKCSDDEVVKKKLKKEKRKASDVVEDKEMYKKKPKTDKEPEMKRESSVSRLERSPCGSLNSVSSSISSHHSRSLQSSSSSKNNSSKSKRNREHRPKDTEGSTPQLDPIVKESKKEDSKSKFKDVMPKEIQSKSKNEQSTLKEEHSRVKEGHSKVKEELTKVVKEEKVKDEQQGKVKEDPHLRTKDERSKEDKSSRAKEDHVRVKKDQPARVKEENHSNDVRQKAEQTKSKEEQNKDDSSRVKEERSKDETKEERPKHKDERNNSKDVQNRNDRCKGESERTHDKVKQEKSKHEDVSEGGKSVKDTLEKKGAKRREERTSSGGGSSKHKRVKEGSHSQTHSQQPPQASQGNQSERKRTSKEELPGSDGGIKASASQESSGCQPNVESSCEAQPQPGFQNGAHPSTPSDCNLNNSTSHHAWDTTALSKTSTEGIATVRPASLEYDTRQHPSDYYMQEAKRLKHQADKEPDRTVQAMKYLEAVLYFIMTGSSMEHARVDTDKVYTLYKETLNLIKHSSLGRHISSKFQKIQHSSAGSTDNKLTILSLRCQSLLYLKLYYLRKPEVKDLQRDLSDFHKSPAGKMVSSQKSPISSHLQQQQLGSSQLGTASSSRCRLQQPSPRGKCIPSSPHSPTPSPAGSVASVCSQSSGYSSSELTGCVTGRHSCSNGLVVNIPQTVYGMMQRHSSHLINLQTCHDLWEQADYLMHRSHSKEFFTQLDAECSRLTLHSTMAELLHYIRKGLSKLKGLA